MDGYKVRYTISKNSAKFPPVHYRDLHVNVRLRTQALSSDMGVSTASIMHSEFRANVQ